MLKGKNHNLAPIKFVYQLLLLTFFLLFGNMSVASIPTRLVFHYFQIPARGEAIRVALRYAKIPFVDDRLDFANWGDHKASYQPWEYLPALEVDGTTIYQTWNILQYVGRIANLVPPTLLEEFKANEVIYGCEDVYAVFASLGPFSDPAKKIEARGKLCLPDGGLYKILMKFDKHLGDKEFVAGNKFTIADAALFATLGNIYAGFFDGIPPSILSTFPRLLAYHQRIAAIPEIAQGYEKEEKPWASGFRVRP